MEMLSPFPFSYREQADGTGIAFVPRFPVDVPDGAAFPPPFPSFP